MLKKGAANGTGVQKGRVSLREVFNQGLVATAVFSPTAAILLVVQFNKPIAYKLGVAVAARRLVMALV